uniref:Uncharacterized protein n=1 Tax=Oryza nivara TaxID=4536 RepID=A0A0E0IE47_ORYNI
MACWANLGGSFPFVCANPLLLWLRLPQAFLILTVLDPICLRMIVLMLGEKSDENVAIVFKVANMKGMIPVLAMNLVYKLANGPIITVWFLL